MQVNIERIINDINTLGELTDTPGNGVTRFSYGENDRIARNYLISEAQKYGLTAETDAIGNIRIFNVEDLGKSKIITGSHIDSVQNGGKFDGILGVVGGLEVLRCLKENNKITDLAIELVIFAEEEGSNFGSTMTGSKFIAGLCNKENLYTLIDNNGKSLNQHLVENDYPIQNVDNVGWDFSRVKAMVELHIEQGPILDNERLDVGIVHTIFGMKAVEITLKGIGNHGGASPMVGRRDALTCAAEIVLEIEKIAKMDRDASVVATVGKLNVFPNASNVVPDSVKFVVDVRDSNNDKIHSVMSEVLEKTKAISKKRKIERECKNLSESAALPMNEKINKIILEIAKTKNLNYRVIDSGAVHDCCMIATKVDTAMIFIPSIDGRSHVPEELSKDEQIEAGAQLLLETVIKLCQTYQA